MTFDSTVQRRIMGHFATGVTVVTTRTLAEATGLTVSSFCSLSLDPPLVSVAIERRCYSYEFLKSSRNFAVNILSLDQQDLSNRFAKSGPKSFADIPLAAGVTGAPIFAEALAWVDCRVVDIFPGGDHEIFVGEIMAGECHEGHPLLYYCGRYRQMGDMEEK